MFLDINWLLENKLSLESYDKFFEEGTFIQMSGRQNKEESSVAFRVYSSFVDEILEGINPQGGKDMEEVMILSPPRKKQNQRCTYSS